MLLVRPDQQYVLSPAFDVLPTGQSLGYQSMVAGDRGAESSVDNALSMARLYWLSPADAIQEAIRVAEVVDGWRAHFVANGVAGRLVEQLEASIDRGFLREQRKDLLSRRAKSS